MTRACQRGGAQGAALSRAAGIQDSTSTGSFPSTRVTTTRPRHPTPSDRHSISSPGDQVPERSSTQQ